jgi:branched-chain amino acid transport system substrate-binding protein
MPDRGTIQKEGASLRPARSRRPSDTLHGPASALVAADGSVSALDDERARWLLAAHPPLLAYALNFLRTDRDAINFLWIGPDKIWHRIAMRLCAAPDNSARAHVEIEPITAPVRLTPRELDVLTLVASGYGNQGIADALSTRPRTVTTHVERILAKLGQTSRAALAGLAVERGLLRLPFPGDGTNRSSLAIGTLDHPSEPHAVAKRLRMVPRPILIGAPLSLQGFARSDAQEMLNGSALAVDEINRRGGIGGRRLELRVVDCDVSDANAVARAFRILIDQDVDAVTSGYSSAEADVQDLMADYGAPYLHCVTMEAMVDRVRQDPQRLRNVFQTGPTDIHYGPECLNFLTGLRDRGRWQPRNKRITVIQPHWSMMNIGSDRMEELADRHGWTLDYISELPLTGIGWHDVLRQAHRIDPAAILLAYYFPEENIAFQRAFAADPLDSLVYTLYGPSVPVYRQELGDAAEGVLWATSTGTYADPIALGFAERYRSMHGMAPGRAHAGIAYDRIHILATAWARAGNPRRFDKVIPEVRRLVHRGVSGTYALDNSGQCGVSYPDATIDPSFAQAHLVFQIQNGRHAILGPHPYADGTFRRPHWFQD